MSRYEWEEGKFKIPSAEWARVKKDIRTKINAEMEKSLVIAEKVHQHMIDAHPKLKGHAAYEAASEFIIRSFSYPRIPDNVRLSIMDVLFPKGGMENEKISRPMKKSFPLLKSNFEYISDSDCSMRFTNDTRTIEWHVHENNHACEHAREGMIGRSLFAVLGTVKWTRGSGGNVWGNDEYNRDSGRDYEGGGGSYQKDSFGPDCKPSPGAKRFISPRNSFGFR